MTQKKGTRRADAATSTINAYRRLFSTEDGQIVLKDLMNSGYMTRTVIGNSPEETYFNEGVRSIVLRIIGTVNMDTKAVERMIVAMNQGIDDHNSF